MVTISGLCSHAQNFVRKLRLCAGCDKKETGCTRASAADTLDLHQVGNGIHGVSKLRRMVRSRPDPTHIIASPYH